MSQHAQIERQVTRMAIGELKPPAEEPRDTGTLPHLAESLKKMGQLCAIIVTVTGIIIAGRRRYAAAQLAGLEFLNVIIVEEGLSDSDAKMIELTENRHRSQLTGYEKWIGDAEWLCMNPGAELKDLAVAMSVDPSTITREMSPSKCVGEVQDALKNGLIGLSDTYAISKHESPDAQRSMLAFKLSGASRDTLEAVGRKRRNGRKPTKVSRIQLALPRVNVVVSGERLSLDSVAQALTDALKEVRRGVDQQFDLRTLSSVMKDKAKAKVVA